MPRVMHRRAPLLQARAPAVTQVMYVICMYAVGATAVPGDWRHPQKMALIFGHFCCFTHFAKLAGCEKK